MGKDSAPKSEAIETPLSREQLGILRSRETFFQDFSQPALENFFEQSKQLELGRDFEAPTFTDLFRGQATQIGDQANLQREQLSIGLAQRGLEGSGVEASSLAQLEAGRRESLRGAAGQAMIQEAQGRDQNLQNLNQAALSEQQIQGGALSQLLSIAPRPTTAAPQQVVQTGGGGGGLGGAIGGAIGGIAGSFVGAPGAGAQIGGGLGGLF